MTNPYVAPHEYPKHDPADSIRKHPAWHAKPALHAVFSRRDIDSLLEAHDNDACRAAGCELRLYLLALRDGQ
ncbi:hypothetical protein VMT65_01540 [Nocardia sp. CDC153]|uniref:hypothetical protein n=1 Tax=Nocardia sp. CDC153 TaxID=3112167 RepID=UPI002DBA8E81|nr:hypothetical protein [Nocardia sp. CDC153]MEC3951705.1 hypothetical protein [Nocardia sp. CDC153]